MSTTSKIGSVFNSLGTGVSAAGPFGAIAGAALSTIGSLVGIGGQIQDRRKEEEEQKRLLEEAKRKAMIDQAQGAAQDKSQSPRPQQAQIEPTTPQQQAATSPAGPEIAPPAQPTDTSQGLAQEQLLSPEIRQMLAGLRQGGGGFYGQG
jgi:hypothetical protein